MKDLPIKIILVSISLLLAARYSNISKADELILVADEWCPYNCTPGSKTEGFMVDIAKSVFEKNGHKVIYKNMPWSRAVVSGRAGEVTGIIGAYKEDAPDFVFPEEALARSGQDFFVERSSEWKFNGLESLEGISLGVIQDYSYGQLLDDYISKNKKDPSKIQATGGDNALNTNLKKLLAGRIKAIVEDKSVMMFNLDLNKAKEKVKAAGGLPTQDVFIAFSPKNPKSNEYANLLSKGIKDMRKNGELDKIFGKYGISSAP